MKPDFTNVNISLSYPFTEEDLKNARRHLLSTYHPDRATDDLKVEYDEISKRINHQYERLLHLCVSPEEKLAVMEDRELKKRGPHGGDMLYLPSIKTSVVAYIGFLIIELFFSIGGEVIYGIWTGKPQWVTSLYVTLIILISIVVLDTRDVLPKRHLLVQAAIALLIFTDHSSLVAVVAIITALSAFPKTFAKKSSYRRYMQKWVARNTHSKTADC